MAKLAESFRFDLSRAEIAEVLGCTPRHVLNLVDDGLPRQTDGRFDIRACYRWSVARAKEKAAAGPARSQEIKDALVAAQRRKLELEIDVMRQRMLPCELVATVLNRIASTVATQLDGLGPRLAGELADEDDPRRVQDTLLREGRATRGAIAVALRELGRDVETGAAFEADED